MNEEKPKLIGSPRRKRKPVDVDEVWYLNKIGWSDHKIARHLGHNRPAITNCRYRLGLQANFPPFADVNADPKKARRNVLVTARRYNKKRYEENPEYFKIYRSNHKDHLNAVRRKNYAEQSQQREKMSEYKKKYYQENKEIILQKAKDYYQKKKQEAET